MLLEFFFIEQIDYYTDTHETVKDSIALLKPVYGRYAGVVTDMIYDYYLARDFEQHSSASLKTFENHCYKILFEHFSYLPDRVKLFLPKMQATRRLQSYANMDGIYESLDIMSKFTSLPNKTKSLKKEFPKIDQILTKQFNTFFPDIKNTTEALRKIAFKKLQE